MGIQNYDFTVPADYAFNPAEISVDGGRVSLVVPLVTGS